MPNNGIRVEENLLYFGANPQVHEDHGNDGDDNEEDVGHLQGDLVHHDQEADGKFVLLWKAFKQLVFIVYYNINFLLSLFQMAVYFTWKKFLVFWVFML